MSTRMRGVFRLIAALVIPLTLLATAPVASAHVNRVVGPYAIFLVLIEEPFFADNRAGFEFWVKRDGQPILGLDRTLTAQAIGWGRRVDLVVSPLNDRGFYDVGTDAQGNPFDPGSGGDWTLRLVGMIEGLQIDESLATVFPGYPRVATTTQPAAVAVPDPFDPAPLLVIAGLALAVAANFVLAARRRGKPTGSAPGIHRPDATETGVAP